MDVGIKLYKNIMYTANYLPSTARRLIDTHVRDGKNSGIEKYFVPIGYVVFIVGRQEGGWEARLHL